MLYLILTAFFGLFAYLARKNIFWGIYLICALLPSYLIRFSIFGLPSTLLEGMVVILFVIWLIKEKINFNPLIWLKNLKQIKNQNFKNNPLPKSLRLPIILLLIAATISVFAAPELRTAAGIWKAYFIEPIMFLLVLAYSLKTIEQIKKIIVALSLTVLVIGILAVIQKTTGALIPNPFWAEAATRRITAFFTHPNAVGLFVGPIIFLIIGNLLIAEKNLWRIYYVLVLTLGILALIWTGSTGALMALTAGLITLFLIYKKIRLPVLLLGLLLSLFLIFTPAVQNKISYTLYLAQQTKLPLVPTDWQMRAQIARESLNMLKDRPLFGAGLAGYQTLVAPYHLNKHIELYPYPHNFFLNFWSETGLLGLMAITWLLIAFFQLSFKICKSGDKILTASLISAMISLLVHGLVDHPYFKNDLAVLFWIIIGLMIVLYNIRWGGRVVEGAALEKQ